MILVVTRTMVKHKTRAPVVRHVQEADFRTLEWVRPLQTSASYVQPEDGPRVEKLRLPLQVAIEHVCRVNTLQRRGRFMTPVSHVQGATLHSQTVQYRAKHALRDSS